MQYSQYNFKKTIEDIKNKHGRGTELVSLYIPHGTQIHEVSSHLRDELGQALNIKSRVTRLNVQSVIQSLLSRLKMINKIPDNGIVIFCGAIDIGANKTDVQTHIIEPIESIKTYKYYCDSSFYTEPLERMFSDKKTFGLIVLDLNEATIGTLKGNSIDVIEYISSMVPKKHKKGGQSAHRFQQLRKIAINEFFSKLGKVVDNSFMNKDLDGIFIGGHSPTKEEFRNGDYIHYQLRNKIMKIYDTGYTDESGLGELVGKLDDEIKNIETVNEKKYMQRFMKQLVHQSDSSILPYGKDSIIKSMELGTVDTLLISERLSKHTVDELLGLTNKTNVNVLFVSDDFEEGRQLWEAFSGIAVIFRYNF
jgi:peptide chain release factor subunit 1